jgi:hypothetical protein
MTKSDRSVLHAGIRLSAKVHGIPYETECSLQFLSVGCAWATQTIDLLAQSECDLPDVPRALNFDSVARIYIPLI